MRKYILLLFILSSLLLNAKHLEFMGIPINGSISSFSVKLKNKGFALLQGNDQLPIGTRGFKGVFAGKECEMYVFYNPKSKIVYQCRVFVDCEYNSAYAVNNFYYFKELLNKKYGDVALTSDMMSDVECDEYEYSLIILEPPIEVGAKVLGTIVVRLYEPGEYSDSYGVVISYDDIDNSTKNEQDSINDL